MRGKVTIVIVAAYGLAPSGSPPSSYVKFKWQDRKKKTPIKVNSHNPNWNSTFELDFDSNSKRTVLRLEVWQSHLFGKNRTIGRLDIDLRALQPNGRSEGWYALQVGAGQIRIAMTLAPSQSYYDVPPGVKSGSVSADSESDSECSTDSEDRIEPEVVQVKSKLPQVSISSVKMALAENDNDVDQALEFLEQKLIEKATMNALDSDDEKGGGLKPPKQPQRKKEKQQFNVDSTEAAAAWLVAETVAPDGGKVKPVPIAPTIAILTCDSDDEDTEAAQISSENRKLVKQLKDVFPKVSEKRIVQALIQCNWDREAALDALLDNQITKIMSTSCQAQEIQQTALLNAENENPNLLESFEVFASQSPAGGKLDKPKPQSQPGLKPSGGLKPAPSVAHSPDELIPASGRQKALLIGINYFGSKKQLSGCVSDVGRIKKLITSTYGFVDNPNHLTVLHDEHTDRRFHPTRRNMTLAMDWLVTDAREGDVLFFQYSGHGSQKRDLNGTELNGFDETILPMDYKQTGQITDDELNARLVERLPHGVKLTAVMDCCHSGTGLDLPYLLDMETGEWRTEYNPKLTLGDVQMFSGCDDDETSADVMIPNWGSGGAMSLALISTLAQNPYGMSIIEVMRRVKTAMQQRGFKQRPQLSSSQQFSTERLFSFTEIHPNTNAMVGRNDPKRKRKQKKEKNSQRHRAENSDEDEKDKRRKEKKDKKEKDKSSDEDEKDKRRKEKKDKKDKYDVEDSKGRRRKDSSKKSREKNDSRDSSRRRRDKERERREKERKRREKDEQKSPRRRRKSSSESSGRRRRRHSSSESGGSSPRHRRSRKSSRYSPRRRHARVSSSSSSY